MLDLWWKYAKRLTFEPNYKFPRILSMKPNMCRVKPGHHKKVLMTNSAKRFDRSDDVLVSGYGVK